DFHAAVTGALFIFGGPNVGGNAGARTFTYTVVPAPSAITVGRGDSGTFRLTVTNLGNFADTVFFGAPQGLPSGWFVTYSPSQTELVRPGLTNATQTVLRVFAPNFAQPGVYPFTLPVSHGFDAPILVPLTVTVSQYG